MGAAGLEKVSPRTEDGTDHVAPASVELRVKSKKQTHTKEKTHPHIKKLILFQSSWSVLICANENLYQKSLIVDVQF